ncbi:uncharacterized protein PAC_09643 [Phialocephala subalpina]|uniref:C2H2-type domain-containing protein n=1 Tax=Phialocephala subalpina TaxID=576137 RepID=A0A1L7X3Z6_9HELO|nr:uncharacterized protein PAC_09643 [Phialocephala subalpina]
MQVVPITEEQESTLRRWASIVGRRPRKKDKAFLQAETGLGKNQVDEWFKSNACIDDSNENVRNIAHASESFGAPEQAISQDTEMTMVDMSSEAFQNDDPLGDLNFDSFDLDLCSMMAFEVQEPQNWSPIGILQEAIPNHQPSMPEVPAKSSLWSPTMAPRGYLSGSTLLSCSESTLTSTTESNPLLSPPSVQHEFLSLSDKCSYESSLWTSDTVSTLVSTCDHHLDDLKDCDYELDEEPSITSAAAVRIISPPVSRFSRHTSVIEEKPRNVHVRSQSENQISSIATIRSQRTPTDPTRSNVIYKCTACAGTFIRKGDWKRHEEGHDPHTLWTCMLGETLVHSRARWNCAFCDAVKKTRDEMTQHLMEEHKVFKCAVKKPMFARKDKLKQHLQQVHALAESSVLWESWHQPARQKWAWGCGYCGACLFTWEGRMIHLADHYEKQPTSTPRWSRSLVVRGLLKQAKLEASFNVANAWRNLTGDEPTSDREVHWPKESAISLKHRLEYHDGTPEQLAAEAFRLAHFTISPSNGHSWI